MNSESLDQTIKALQSICGKNANQINSETKIMEDLGLESIDFVDFVFELERVSGVQIDITQLSIQLSSKTGRRFREINVGAVAEYLEKLKTR